MSCEARFSIAKADWTTCLRPPLVLPARVQTPVVCGPFVAVDHANALPEQRADNGECVKVHADTPHLSMLAQRVLSQNADLACAASTVPQEMGGTHCVVSSPTGTFSKRSIRATGRGKSVSQSSHAC